ncbi:MAG: LysR family transcriptional regulator [Proteobacteria bacterium]|nr:LysR family transcriptional regulator [Pseudomonadota bacterium]
MKQAPNQAPPSPDRRADALDGHLLRVLCTLIETGSVSRAAHRLGETQPAVSAALKRLREIFNDPLLVREKLVMVPTARAQEIAAPARAALAGLHHLVVPTAGFDPRDAERTFRVASPDYMSPAMLASVARRIRTEAPGCRLEVHALGPAFDYAQALALGQIDVIVGNWPRPPEHLHLSLLLEDEMVCLIRRGHPLLENGALTEAAYLAAAHVVPTPYSMTQLGVVDTHLATLKTRRDDRVVVPYFGLAPHVVAESDLVFTTSRHFAEPYTRSLPLAMVKAPGAFPTMRFYQLWHEREHHAPAHRWLRAAIAEAGRALATSSTG